MSSPVTNASTAGTAHIPPDGTNKARQVAGSVRMLGELLLQREAHGHYGCTLTPQSQELVLQTINNSFEVMTKQYTDQLPKLEVILSNHIYLSRYQNQKTIEAERAAIKVAFAILSKEDNSVGEQQSSNAASMLDFDTALLSVIEEKKSLTVQANSQKPITTSTSNFTPVEIRKAFRCLASDVLAAAKYPAFIQDYLRDEPLELDEPR